MNWSAALKTGGRFSGGKLLFQEGSDRDKKTDRFSTSFLRKIKYTIEKL